MTTPQPRPRWWLPIVVALLAVAAPSASTATELTDLIAPPQRLTVPAGVDAAELELVDRYGREIPLEIQGDTVTPPALPGGAYTLRWRGGEERFNVTNWEAEEFGAGEHADTAITERDSTGAYVGSGSTGVATGFFIMLSVFAVMLAAYGARRRRKLPLLLSAGAVTIAVFTYIGFISGGGAVRPADLNPTAFAAVRAEVAGCEAEPDWRLEVGCVDRILNRLSVTDQLAMVEDPELARAPWFMKMCHGVAHGLGRAHWTWYVENPGAAAEAMSGCGWGYFHGVSQYLAVYESRAWFNAKMPSVCHALGGVSAEVCIHGLGHAIARRTNLNTGEAHQLCTNASRTPRELANCADGYFMELSGALHAMRAYPSSGGLPVGVNEQLRYGEVCRETEDLFGGMCASHHIGSELGLAPGVVPDNLQGRCDSAGSALLRGFCELGIGSALFYADIEVLDAYELCTEVSGTPEIRGADCFGGYLYPLSLGGFSIDESCATLPEAAARRCRSYLETVSRDGTGTFIGGVEIATAPSIPGS